MELRPSRSSLLHGLVTGAAVSLALVALGCGGSSVRWSPGWSSSYSRFSTQARDRFAAARELYDDGLRIQALAGLRDLSEAEPDNLEIGAWVQDVESELLMDGEDLFAESVSLHEFAAPDVLRLVYAARKDEEPTVTSFVLAARVETDVIAAETLLGRALELDPTCAWAHYGRSHVLLMDRSRADRWGQAGDALDRALSLDPGHLRARRLEAWMQAEEGSRDKAAKNLLRWIELTEDDPRVSRRDQVEARLDLALLFLLDGEDGRAERLLGDLEGVETGRARRLTLLAVARQEAGDELGALEAALRAQGAERGAALPLMQEALLHELSLGDPAAAEARWRAVAALGSGTTDIADLVRGLRARVRLERVERDSPEPASEGGGGRL